MPTYYAAADVTISVTGKTEADSQEEAVKKFNAFNMVQLCTSCTRRNDNAWQVNDIDGEPLNIVIDGEPLNIAVNADE